ncbi:MAG: hypothetical protein ACTSVZ_03810 [Promethearchaeota archaeon]
MKCEFCHREATTTIHNVMGTETYHVCDFCEEDLIKCEAQELLHSVSGPNTNTDKNYLLAIQSKVALHMKTPSSS